ERETVLAPQHVVDAARAGLIRAGEDRQAPDGVLAVLGGGERPAGIVQQLVDQRGAWLVLAVVVGVGGDVGGPRCGEPVTGGCSRSAGESSAQPASCSSSSISAVRVSSSR